MEALLLSIPQTSEALNLGRTKIYELIAEGRLKTVTVGRRRLVRVDSVKALAEAAGA